MGPSASLRSSPASPRTAAASRAVGAATIAEAFRITAEDHPDWPAGCTSARRAPRRHRRPDARQPAGVPHRRPRRHEPRGDAVLRLPDLDANDKLARVEQVKRFTIVEGDWLPGGDELTPTMKLKRRPIGEKYAGAIDAMYAG